MDLRLNAVLNVGPIIMNQWIAQNRSAWIKDNGIQIQDKFKIRLKFKLKSKFRLDSNLNLDFDSNWNINSFWLTFNRIIIMILIRS